MKLNKRPRRICVVTGARSEYGLLSPIIARIASTSGLELRLIVAGMHLAQEFGNTWREVERDGFRVDARIDMTFSGDTAGAMAKSIGIGIYGMAQAIESLQPDIVLVLGDRVEAFAGAVSGSVCNTVVAHVHGGDRAKGGLDDFMRHAITKFAHIHFAATEKSRERIIRMGERPEMVYTVGAPGVDLLLNTEVYGREVLESRLGYSLKKSFVLVVQHSVSTTPDTAPVETKETMEALKAVHRQTILIYPNADAGGRRVIEVIESYRSEPWLHIAQNLDRLTYLSLLANANVLVGNSSSGIIEAPSLHVPVVNIGTRQEGRERSTNVIDTPHERVAIQKAMMKALTDRRFRAQVKRCINPYADGKAGRRIVDVLQSTKIAPDLLQKQITF